jgi:hypothetical protein
MNSKASNISSLSELRERREKIKAEQEAARQGLTSTLATAPEKAKEYALEDLALPALGIGLAVYVGYRVLRPARQAPEPTTPAQAQYLQHPQSAQQVDTPPVRVPRPANPPREPRPVPTKAVVKRSFNFAKLIAAGKLLVPAAQAIISAVQEHQKTQ